MIDESAWLMVVIFVGTGAGVGEEWTVPLGLVQQSPRLEEVENGS